MGVEVEDRYVEEDAALALAAWPDDFVPPRSPWSLSHTGLAWRVAASLQGRVIVVIGDERSDFLLFHGLSRVSRYIYWLPESRLETRRIVDYLKRAVTHVARAAIGGGNAVTITSATNPGAVAALVDSWGGQPGATPAFLAEDWRTLIPRLPTAVADVRSERRAALVIHEGETQEVPPVQPVAVDAADPFNLHWMVDLEVRGWTPYRHRRLGASTLRQGLMTDHDVRTSRFGIAYYGYSAFIQPSLGVEAALAQPRLAPKAIVDQVREVLQPEGWTVAQSDKGAFATQTATLFDGIEGLVSALRDHETRSLLNRYLDRRTAEGPGLFSTETGRRYLRIRDAEELLSETDVAVVITRLYDAGVLQRGHILKCEYCRSTSFYALSESQRFICNRCRTEQRASRFHWLGSPEPPFYYALSEVVYQFLHHNGQLPLLAAYDYFVHGRGHERQAFDVAFELELTPPGRDLGEHDIIATWGAELWVGEATSAANFGTARKEVARVRRLQQIARLLSARGVLLVTERPDFGPRTREVVATTFNDVTWPELVWVTGFDTSAVADVAATPA